ncbi:type II secretion system F family protein [Defluviimonas sp. WL0024]|uniref:Type II secretion system F family protein n=2 Tax=Albidovulum TaxID=205889 RepID=A0ABT3J441_9RHOB|nr:MULTISPECIES: type II secretion system F family protein [Defluviimonas]MCU9847844.1 type II secretion system F family protein [Defluviimonas sp. WL0024]MCW3782443.1 type II secretion system F family protein [Defluviimonas salinarum]
MTSLPQFELSSLAYVGVFLGALLIFEGLRQIVTRSESRTEARNRRMRMIADGASTEDILRLLKPRTDGWQLKSLPLIGTLPADIRKAGLTIKPGAFLSLCLAATGVVALAASTVTSPLTAAGVAVLACLVLPLLRLRALRNKRIKDLVQQLPDALDLMARSLKVGHPLNTSIAAVARDMRDPIASEFGIVVDQVSYGDDLVDAFTDFADRIDVEDVRYLAVSVAIQHGTGGDLARVLSTLSKVIRDRMAMRRRIQAISAEGRLTAVFLSALPILIFLGSSVTNPNYYWGISGDPLFRPFAAVVVALTVGNYIAMRRLVNFRI